MRPRSLRALHAALSRFANADAAARPAIDAQIWATFGTLGAPLVLDMAGFSQTVKRRGVVPFLAMVQRMQALSRPHVEAHGGKVIKFEADNLFACFVDVPQAFAAAQRILEACAGESVALPEDRITVSIGIDYGQLLEVPGVDYFGECVNTASKLGEDLAGAGEILLTRGAALRLPATDRMAFTEAQAEASAIQYDVFSWSPERAGATRA